ncbi:CDG_1a_G0025680.mRNA.1.CDS.1 [Saccharomyces cerevisiae]|nr:CDG_1a_G0025680.mRNA.1.CDS.1 [Saccharomyces cerevisiae]CAI7344674.1 CDG_1a_G0025680.mRNA.1.CDS.1 [Saccharomyces cerevisiae]
MIVNNTHVLTLPLYTTTTTCHTHHHLYIDMAYAHGCYSIYHLKLTLLSYSIPWPISHFISKYAPTSLFTALASAVYTLCHLPIKPMIIHILISISHSAAPNIV